MHITQCTRIFGLCPVLVAILYGQAYRERLLHDTVTISGVVVDESGVPLADAQIGHTGTQPSPGGSAKTDVQGRFSIATRGPLMVIRKPGYTSASLRTRDIASNSQRRLVLRSIERTLPFCRPTERYESLGGWGAWFRFTPRRGIRAREQRQDIDYGIRVYLLESRKGGVGIAHGSGPMWSAGVPLDEEVWKSVAFEEESFEVEGLTILDSRGKWEDGTRWRTLRKFGETVSYFKVDEESARALDQFLDGVCIATLKHPATAPPPRAWVARGFRPR
jgi:hypothetical protein